MRGVMVGVLCVAWSSAFANEAAQKPNVLFILVDDLGKEWVGCYGAQGIRTPHIDALAKTGLRFENAYCMPQCTPTRVTLLTGQYPYRHGWTNHFDVPRWGSGCHFDPSKYPVMGRMFRRAGYATAIAGKWQIDDFRVEKDALDKCGFDSWCVWTGGEGGNPKSHERYANPYVFTGKAGEPQQATSRTHAGKFGPDVYCDFLIDFMKNNKQKPMFLYFPMCLTHGPLVPTPDEPQARGKMARHKAMVRYTDKLIGKLIKTLDDLKIRDNTIIVFTTDNGTSGGITGTRNGKSVRGAKSKMNEAGTAIPFIVNCPGKVPVGITRELTDFTDMYPTFAELAGSNRKPPGKLDGHSIAPLLLGKSKTTPRKWILSMGGRPAKFRDNRVVPAQTFDDRVIRDKRWKLWVSTDRKPTQLYDLQNDPWEEKNLIDNNDEESRRALARLWNVIKTHPKADAAPKYDPNPPQKWDRFRFRK